SNSIDPAIAGVVAAAMKDWAVEKGVTHYTHWFQPLTGITAEKHDSFLSPTADGGIITEFSGKELTQGEPDASSFPSGGLRATFEARGYTAWDPTSYAFIKDDILYIPTVFCSYTGEVLDQKTPLLRSMDRLSDQAVRVLKGLGEDVTRVTATVGPEQEYFLVDKTLYKQRKDLRLTGRTLLGAPAAKGQELEDHYFGIIKPRVQSFMKDLNVELWKLGILAKTEHNEVAPAQHELAPIYTTANIATDHNQLTMELMKTVAERHGLVCLLHEKPFAGVNGSGKHNNWAISTNKGENLFDPGPDPAHNTRFLVFLSAVVTAVDDYQDLLRVTVASAGNDHRLGANEAPPAIVSIFLGDEIGGVVDSMVAGKTFNGKGVAKMNSGVSALPEFLKDTTDRNRTSPFAFTGNKFEFRMVGSTFNIAVPNMVLNTILAEALDGIAARLEKGEAPLAVATDLIKKHQRIIFNGNNYAAEWTVEAEKRGLLNLNNTIKALPKFADPKNVKLFTKHGIFTAQEVHSRYEVSLENYVKVINIEALTLLDMINHDILPAAESYSSDLAKGIAAKRAVADGLKCTAEVSALKEVSELTDKLYAAAAKLTGALAKKQDADPLKTAAYFHDTIVALTVDIRKVADALEGIVGAKYWPIPTYTELLFGV
ncbi:MAG: glutamine synthetase III, partial [Clostridiales bacterium]|nr:glutamine synthetase III [Clostridiales bacterium]